MEDRVILDVMNEFFLPQGRYPENFLLISQLEVCQEGGSRRGVLGGRWGVLTGDLEDRAIFDVINDVLLPQGRYPENFVLISQLKVCQEGGGSRRWAWLTLKAPDMDDRAIPDVMNDV